MIMIVYYVCMCIYIYIYIYGIHVMMLPKCTKAMLNHANTDVAVDVFQVLPLDLPKYLPKNLPKYLPRQKLPKYLPKFFPLGVVVRFRAVFTESLTVRPYGQQLLKFFRSWDRKVLQHTFLLSHANR